MFGDSRLPKRFWDKTSIDAATGCWIWKSTMNNHGYGRIRMGGRRGRQELAHRLAYSVLVSDPPVGMELDHLCRNPACVNPAHLEPVSHRENIRRGKGALKTHCTRGHLLDEANTYIHPVTGWRRCRRCRADGMRRPPVDSIIIRTGLAQEPPRG